MMMRMSVVVAAALTIVAGPASARCVQPYAPVVKINASTTKQDVASLRNDMASFIAASDVYQACLVSQHVDRSMVDANQAEKERVGKEFNAALRTYLSSHPG